MKQVQWISLCESGQTAVTVVASEESKIYGSSSDDSVSYGRSDTSSQSSEES